jgi:hypothetical protein
VTRAQEHADQVAGDEKLKTRPHSAAAMPAVQAMAGEELPATGTRQSNDVLDVRSGRRKGARDGRIERPTNGGERENGRNPGADLEAPVEDVLVRHQVAQEVEQQSERNRAQPRTDERAARRAGRDVQRDDQARRP